MGHFSFPRFPSTVAQELLPRPAMNTTDRLTALPRDILDDLLPFLDDKSFLRLLSTCRTLRRAALTTLQYHARSRVLAHRWALLTPREAVAAKVVVEKGLMLDPNDVTHEGNWVLYLSSLYKSTSMRNRRRVWTVAEELHRAYLEQTIGSKWDDVVRKDETIVKSKVRARFEKLIASSPACTESVFPNPWL